MKQRYIPVLAAAALAALSGAAGAWLGVHLFHPSEYTHKQFHRELFSELRLDQNQRAMMDAMEARHKVEVKALRQSLSLANSGLAKALTAETEYGEDVENAIVEAHMATLELQKSSVRHLFAMRKILNDEQKEIFDRHVADTLREYADRALD